MAIDGACIKRWNKNGFTLRIFDFPFAQRGDRRYYGYELKDGRKVIFEGRDFGPGYATAPDSLEAVYGILGFLTVQEGDTDREYFEKYTEEQMAWTRSRRCEELNLMVYDWEMKREEAMTHERRGERNFNRR